jgi:REP element-mobilizing transposase RayT
MTGPYPHQDHVGRKHPARGVLIDIGQPTIVFLTVNTRDRKAWLTQPVVHECLRKVWLEAQAWLVGYYLLMPNHLHLFCAPRDLNFTLEEWVTYWKRQFKRHINQEFGKGTAASKLSTNTREGETPSNRDQTNQGSTESHPPSDDQTNQGSTESHPPDNDQTNQGSTESHAPSDDQTSHGSTESHPPMVGNPADYR